MRPLAGLMIAAVAFAGCDEAPRRSAGGRSGGGQPKLDATVANEDGSTDPGLDAGTSDAGALVPDAGVTPGQASLAAGIRLKEIAIYQGVKIQLTRDNAPISRRNAPVVQGRPALIRVFVQPTFEWQPREVVVHLTLESSSRAVAPQSVQKHVTVASTEENTESTFNFFLDGEDVTHDLAWSAAIEEVAPGVTGPGAVTDARYPDRGATPLGAQDSGPSVQVVLVPVRYDFDGSARLPDTSPAQLERYREGMFGMYPARDVEITVRQPLAWSREVAPFGEGWGELLQAILNLRQRDNVPTNVYYYGAVSPLSSLGAFCGRGCVAGLSTLSRDPANDYVRGSIGLGYAGDNAVGTFVHEVGHAHGREHAPCQVRDSDPQYPYAGGTIGVWGYDITTRRLLSPDRYRDMMGYCDPRWISDYQYNALFLRMSYVNSIAAFIAPEGLPATWRVVLLDGLGGAKWGETAELPLPPTGEPRDVVIAGEDGEPIEVLDGRFIPFDHLPGGMLMFPEPAGGRWVHLKDASHPLPLR